MLSPKMGVFIACTHQAFKMDHIMPRPSRPEAKIPDINGEPEEGVSHTRICAADGCRAEALYRAPKSRDALRDYIWFCREHVRA